jgi:hypothetical protein
MLMQWLGALLGLWSADCMPERTSVDDLLRG